VTGDIKLSICISSFNKGKRCRDLVNRILEYNDPRINVVVTDDCSDEDTCHELSSIKNDRYVLYRNSTNLRACKNWYQTINNGNGEYLLHILDRDYINMKMVGHLLDVLEKDYYGVGYVGDFFLPSRGRNDYIHDYVICPGDAAVAELGCILIHPTGFLINRDVWKSFDLKQYFYNEDKYGIYPHTYVMAKAAQGNPLLFIPGKFWMCTYSSETKHSAFYKGYVDKKLYWWEPVSVVDTGLRILLEVSKNIISSEYKKELSINSFRDILYRSTIIYSIVISNKTQMSHYGVRTRKASLMGLFCINAYVTKRYIRGLSELMILDGKTFFNLIKCSIRNYREVINHYW